MENKSGKEEFLMKKIKDDIYNRIVNVTAEYLCESFEKATKYLSREYKTYYEAVGKYDKLVADNLHQLEFIEDVDYYVKGKELSEYRKRRRKYKKIIEVIEEIDRILHKYYDFNMAQRKDFKSIDMIVDEIRNTVYDIEELQNNRYYTAKFEYD